jgi:GNAT superfamily N-acetyltransferase
MTGSTAVAKGVVVHEIPHGASLGNFIDLAWTVNAGDPAWVPPLRLNLKGVLDRKKHPFHEHADVAYFLALRGGRPAGRIAAILNHRYNEFHNDHVGFFGLFECEDEHTTAQALVEAATSWLRDRGCTVIRGPVNLSTNDELASPGVLIEGFSAPPAVMMTHNPPYYAALLEGTGLVKARDLIAFWFDDPAAVPSRGARTLDRLLERQGATIRALDPKRFRQDVDAIKEVYNAAWTRNWGFVPMTDAEFDHLAREFRFIVDPDLCLIAEVAGEPIGFSLTIPDLNLALRHLSDGRLFPTGLIKLLWHRRRIDSMRVMTLGFKPPYQHAGLGPAFYIRTWQTGVSKGICRGEGSWILEENQEMVRPLERMGGRIYKRYRIFEREL